MYTQCDETSYFSGFTLKQIIGGVNVKVFYLLFYSIALRTLLLSPLKLYYITSGHHWAGHWSVKKKEWSFDIFLLRI